MKIGILNSGGYNINSIIFALNRLGIDDIIIIDSKIKFNECDKFILPGVGHAKTAMEMIHEQNLEESIRRTTKPVMGICLGMQIMCNFSEEGDTQCLGIINHRIIRLPSAVHIPQMGWNKINNTNNFVYFANSFYLPICEYTVNYVEYGGIKISASIKKDNFIGYQFHPEKSGHVGAKILQDFIHL